MNVNEAHNSTSNLYKYHLTHCLPCLNQSQSEQEHAYSNPQVKPDCQHNMAVKKNVAYGSSNMVVRKNVAYGSSNMAVQENQMYESI